MMSFLILSTKCMLGQPEDLAHNEFSSIGVFLSELLQLSTGRGAELEIIHWA